MEFRVRGFRARAEGGANAEVRARTSGEGVGPKWAQFRGPDNSNRVLGILYCKLQEPALTKIRNPQYSTGNFLGPCSLDKLQIHLKSQEEAGDECLKACGV